MDKRGIFAFIVLGILVMSIAGVNAKSIRPSYAEGLFSVEYGFLHAIPWIGPKLEALAQERGIIRGLAALEIQVLNVRTEQLYPAGYEKVWNARLREADKSGGIEAMRQEALKIKAEIDTSILMAQGTESAAIQPITPLTIAKYRIGQILGKEGGPQVVVGGLGEGMARGLSLPEEGGSQAPETAAAATTVPQAPQTPQPSAGGKSGLGLCGEGSYFEKIC